MAHRKIAFSSNRIDAGLGTHAGSFISQMKMEINLPAFHVNQISRPQMH